MMMQNQDSPHTTISAASETFAEFVTVEVPLEANDRQPELRGSFTIAIAAYVIAQFFDSEQIVLRSESAGTDALKLAPAPTKTAADIVREIADQLIFDCNMEVILEPDTGLSNEWYCLTYVQDDRGFEKLKLTGPRLARGRIAVEGVLGAIASALRDSQYDLSRTLGGIALVGEALSAEILGELAGQPLDYGKDKTIVQLFEAQAAKVPDQEAVVFAERRLSYGELDRLSNGLARSLLEAGLDKGELVPVVLNNCLELPVTLIALMKIGAPFVIVDGDWPADRMDKVMTRLDPKLLVHKAADSVSAARDARHLAVDIDRIVPVDGIPDRPKVTVADVIYGFFTSGSTGIPKCTLNLHLGLLNRFQYMTRRFGRGDGEVILQNSKHVFDSSLWQLLWPLTQGARVVVPPSSSAPDLRGFLNLIEGEGVTMTDIVPSVFKLIRRLIEQEPKLSTKLASMRRIVLGGEEINPHDIAAFRNHCPQVAFTNTYGPTEASIGMIFHDVGREENEQVPLGRPIDNTYALVLDDSLRLVPPGMIGEIVIGGDCLGLGYLGDQEATRTAFIENPFGTIPSRQLYHTGDLGYLRPDRTFQYSGRRDHQVKVGGVRIETLEIEAVIRTHPKVSDVRVIAHKNRLGNTQLVSFVVPADDDAPDVLRRLITRAAARHLPANFIPQRYVFLEALPLTPNGKADRRRMTAMLNVERIKADIEFTDETECGLAKIWRELLNLQTVGPDDDFFSLGGDSLQALTLTLEIERCFSVSLDLEEVFSFSTLRAQAAFLRGEVPKVVVIPGESHPMPRLIADSNWPTECEVVSPRKANPPRRILLTGATGFVGAHLAAALLASPGTTLVCPLRARDDKHAEARLIDALSTYMLWRHAFSGRLEAIASDLSEPSFGLGTDRFREILATTDVAVLNASKVNFLLDYEKLKSVNVESVREVLTTALTKTGTPVHLISSLAVFAGEKCGAKVGEDMAPTVLPGMGGYAQSKWVTDRLALAARAAGGAVTVHRLGEMMPSLRTGIANPSALTTRLLTTLLKLGIYPTDDALLDYTPVDIAADLVARAVLTNRNRHTFHLCHDRPISLGALTARLAAAMGFGGPLEAVSGEVFLKRLHSACQAAPLDQDLQYVAALISKGTPISRPLSALFDGDPSRYASKYLHSLAMGAEPLWPDIAQEALAATASCFAARLSATSGNDCGAERTDAVA